MLKKTSSEVFFLMLAMLIYTSDNKQMNAPDKYPTWKEFQQACRESHTTEERWEQAFRDAGLRYRKTSVAHALVALCVFHDERTPSMWAYPSGKLYCYGCAGKSSLEWFEEFGSDTVAINGISKHKRRLRLVDPVTMQELDTVLHKANDELHTAQRDWTVARDEAWCIEHGLAPPRSFKETEQFEPPVPLTIFENDPYADLPFQNDGQG